MNVKRSSSNREEQSFGGQPLPAGVAGVRPLSREAGCFLTINNGVARRTEDVGFEGCQLAVGGSSWGTQDRPPIGDLRVSRP